jgi:hypothetical protein
MRKSLSWVSTCVFALAVACSPYELRQAAVGDKTPREVGFEVELAHFPTTGFARLKPGIHVVDDVNDWRGIFNDHSQNFQAPHPPEVDWTKTMALVATATDDEATVMTIDRVVKTDAGFLHVYVNEELRGDRCEPPTPTNVLRAEAHEPPIDIVTITKSSLPMVVHLDRAKGLSCDPLPKPDMRCNVKGHPPNDMSATIEAAPGDTIECDGTKVTTTVGYVTERNWYFERKPADSFTQMATDDKRMHASFVIDAFGEYRVRMEAEDDRHKSGDKKVQIDVAPPQDIQVIQVGWTLHGPPDQTTLPKFEPHLIELGTGRECSEAHAQPPWCEVKISGLTKQIFVKTQRSSRYRLVVGYLDDRAPQMPVLCARAFVKGATVALETCDFKERAAKDTWEPGTFNPQTGSFDK